jgi:TIR domain
MTPPKAFLCHATPDKDIYVLPFAKYLASKGIDPWVDGWEIKLGDSLLTKIEAGIEDADYFLPFVSPRSADRPWVRSEIEMAVTRRMLSKLRIIPVLIGVAGHETPLFLQTILGVKVGGEEGIPAAAQRVVDTIYTASSTARDQGRRENRSDIAREELLGKGNACRAPPGRDDRPHCRRRA